MWASAIACSPLGTAETKFREGSILSNSERVFRRSESSSAIMTRIFSSIWLSLGYRNLDDSSSVFCGSYLKVATALFRPHLHTLDSSMINRRLGFFGRETNFIIAYPHHYRF